MRLLPSVSLKSGEVVSLRALSAGQYLDMQEALEALGADETLSKKAKIKRGFAIKIRPSVCDDSGVLRFETVEAAIAWIDNDIEWKDATAIIAAINGAGELTDKALDTTEKN